MVAPIGGSDYHSLQAQLTRRFANGYSVNAAYTWSKSMSDTGLSRSDQTLAIPIPEYYHLNRSVTDFDRTHVLQITNILELPFGKGRRLAANAPGVVKGIIGGWQLNAVVTRQSGMALGFGNPIFYGDIKNIDLPADQRSVDRWFNTDAGFERNSTKQLVSSIRTFPLRFGGIRGPRQFYWDMSALKRIPIHEKVNLEFRAEAYNALNHPNFNAPNTSPASSAFGQITSQDANPRQWQLSLKLAF